MYGVTDIAVVQTEAIEKPYYTGPLFELQFVILQLYCYNLHTRTS